MSEHTKDPRTLEAIKKIKAVLTEYDLVGFLAVISPERAHWVYHVDASWSALSINTETGVARVKVSPADFKTSEQYFTVVKLTAHAIYQGRDLAAQQHRNMMVLINMLEQQVEVEHVPGADLEIVRTPETQDDLKEAKSLVEQLCKDLNQAHDQLMVKVHSLAEPKLLDWPEWTPQANSIRWAERLLGKKLAKTDLWTEFPEKKEKENEGH